jgi:hypothetical protein
VPVGELPQPLDVLFLDTASLLHHREYNSATDFPIRSTHLEPIRDLVVQAVDMGHAIIEDGHGL